MKFKLMWSKTICILYILATADLSFFLVRATELSVKLTPCYGKVAGASCDIKCDVPNADDVITFLHPPGQAVGGCQQDGTCSSNFNHSINIDVKKRQATLTIHHLDIHNHAGPWLCAYGAVQSPPVTLKVYVAPTIERASIYISATEGQTLNLNCDVNAHNQQYAISWFHNGNEIDNITNYGGGFYGNPSLTIYNLNKNLSGEYRCSLTVPPGSSNTQNGSKLKINIKSVEGKTTTTILEIQNEDSIGSTISLAVIAILLFIMATVHVLLSVTKKSERVWKRKLSYVAENGGFAVMSIISLIILFTMREKLRNKFNRTLALVILVLMLIVMAFQGFALMFHVRKNSNGDQKTQKGTDAATDIEETFLENL